MQQRRIPTLVGLLLTLVLLGGLAVSTSLVDRVTKLFSRAEESQAPSSPAQVGNITESGFTVYWITDQENTGTVFWGKTSKLGDGVAIDDRNMTTPDEKDSTHFVKVTGVLPQQKYYFQVGSGSNSFGDPTKNGAPYEITTGVKLTTPPAGEPVYGKVLDSSGSPAAGVIAVWETEGATRIGALSKSDGTYVLPVANARTTDLSGFSTLNSGGAETISLNGGPAGKSTITCKAGLDQPLPTVKLGQDSDCSKGSAPAPTAPSGFKATTATPAATLTTNVSEGETVSTPLPTISGTAGPNQTVKIEIHSTDVFSATVKADPAGNWSWTPPSNLSVGQHTVTITVVAADGTTQTITRTFYVSSTESILPVTSGTPSANLTHRECVSNSCTVVSGAGSDSCQQNSDCAPAPMATPPATPPPVTGRTEDTLVLLTIGAILGTLGIVLFRWTVQL